MSDASLLETDYAKERAQESTRAHIITEALAHTVETASIRLEFSIILCAQVPHVPCVNARNLTIPRVSQSLMVLAQKFFGVGMQDVPIACSNAARRARVQVERFVEQRE